MAESILSASSLRIEKKNLFIILKVSLLTTVIERNSLRQSMLQDFNLLLSSPLIPFMLPWHVEILFV